MGAQKVMPTMARSRLCPREVTMRWSKSIGAEWWPGRETGVPVREGKSADLPFH